LRTTANRHGGTQQRSDRILRARLLHPARHGWTERGDSWIRGKPRNPTRLLICISAAHTAQGYKDAVFTEPENGVAAFSRITFCLVHVAQQTAIKSMRLRQGASNMNPGRRDMADRASQACPEKS
jgi:hypothetical protein